MWGVRISEVSYGSWLTISSQDQATADALHRTAYECGINFFDTANVYGGGKTEEMVGRALKSFRRDTYVLATKVYFPAEKDWPFPGANDRGLSRKHVLEQCERSLRRLDTDRIDLYQCHRFDAETPLIETCRAFSDLINQGKALYWGVSEWTGEQINDAVEICHEHNWHSPVSSQPVYNMLQRHWEEKSFPACARHGLGIVCFSPLAEGILTGKYSAGIPEGSRGAHPKNSVFMKDLLTERNLALVARLSELAAGLGVSMACLALAWCLRRREVSSVIVGASRPEQIRENAGASALKLDDDVLDQIKAILGD
jgi:aryl-alcohol dehydrogenase-like predicted oxidoreductase